MRSIAIQAHDEIIITKHAFSRMSQRSISREAILTVLQYGRRKHEMGAIIYFLGQKELKLYQKHGLDLRMFFNLHVVVAEENGKIIIVTVYKNQKLKKTKVRKHWMIFNKLIQHRVSA